MSWNPGRYSSQDIKRKVNNVKVTFTLSGFIFGALFGVTSYNLIQRTKNIIMTSDAKYNPSFYHDYKRLDLITKKGKQGIEIYVADRENKELQMGVGYDMHEQSPGGLVQGLNNRIEDGYFQRYFKKNPHEKRKLEELVSKLQEHGYMVKPQKDKWWNIF